RQAALQLPQPRPDRPAVPVRPRHLLPAGPSRHRDFLLFHPLSPADLVYPQSLSFWRILAAARDPHATLAKGPADTRSPGGLRESRRRAGCADPPDPRLRAPAVGRSLSALLCPRIGGSYREAPPDPQYDLLGFRGTLAQLREASGAALLRIGAIPRIAPGKAGRSQMKAHISSWVTFDGRASDCQQSRPAGGSCAQTAPRERGLGAVSGRLVR